MEHAKGGKTVIARRSKILNKEYNCYLFYDD